MPAELVHATAIAAAGRGALIRGPSGSGKSDLALRCLMVAPGPLIPSAAELISDDQVVLDRTGHVVRARAPAAIEGKLEVRGLGIITVPQAAREPVAIALVVDLTRIMPERLPDPWPQTTLLGLSFPLLTLDPFEASAPLKLLLALTSPALPRLG